MTVFILIFTEYGYYDGEQDSHAIIGAFTDIKKAQDAEKKIYIERGQPSNRGRNIDGQRYSIRGSTDIKKVQIDQYNQYGVL